MDIMDVFNHIMDIDMPGPVKYILLALLGFCRDERGFSCSPSLRELARAASMSEEDVRRDLQLAQTAGWFTLDVNAEDGQRNIYTLNVEALARTSKMSPPFDPEHPHASRWFM